METCRKNKLQMLKFIYRLEVIILKWLKNDRIVLKMQQSNY